MKKGSVRSKVTVLRTVRFVFAVGFACMSIGAASAQAEREGDSGGQETSQVETQRGLMDPDALIRVNRGGRLPAAAMQRLDAINFKNTDLRDVLRAIAEQSGLNLIVDDSISERVTVALNEVSVLDAVVFLAEEYGLSLVQTDAVFRIRVPPPPLPQPPPPPRAIPITIREGELFADFQGDDVRQVARQVAEASGTTVLVRSGASGSVRGFVQGVSFEAGLRSVLENSGFALYRDDDGIYTIDRAYFEATDEAPAQGSYVRVDGTGVELQLRDADAARALRQLARQSGDGIVTYSMPAGRTVTASASGLTVEEALGVILRGTGVSFRQERGVWVVGSTTEDGLAATELIRLGYTRVDGVLELIPDELRSRATIRAIPEQNGILVTGSNDAIAEVEAFLRALDYPAPQILIEALVVDFLDTDATRFGFSFGRGLFASDSLAAVRSGYRLDGLGDGSYVIEGGGAKANYYLDQIRDFFGIGNIGRLPDDFYFRIEALAQEGRLEVRSRPQIATLSGNTASISIGTTQYYILESETPYQSSSQVITQTTQRFEKIEANVSLEITPFVSPTGEVTVTIKPEFSTPVGQFTPEVPPTISSRVIESNVRLRDGETIILGGLISDEDVIEERKVPILGDIPILGWFFRSRVRTKQRSELVIYLTPHVFYGDERDDERWRRVADRLDLRDEGVFMEGPVLEPPALDVLQRDMDRHH